MKTAIPLWEIPSLPVAGSDARFPVRQILCVGRNYADHVREMGHDPDREEPFFFMKPAAALVQDGESFAYPPGTRDLHHEVELVAAIAEGGRNISPKRAMTHVFGFAVGIDMTRRDLQGIAKQKGQPWEIGKAFEGSAPCGALLPAAEAGAMERARITLKVNGETRQSGDVGQMIWKLPEIIAKLSELYSLRAGDLIFTGTPAGVGPVEAGDSLEAEVEGLPPLKVSIRKPD
jgi:fumarylpyruvate hydrolase